MNEILMQLPAVLLPWFDGNKRDLPWRQDKNPYHVWLSEIMLQQTRVEAVRGYYTRFLENLPTVETLANCDDELLHKLWEGLGYYSRVRNLKKAACAILDTHGGAFPTDYSAVLALPGIGDYTAGAICSIAFDQQTPAVDGNVLRVYARLMNDDSPIDAPAFKARVRQQLAEIYPQRAGDFTQALMELGATLCGPNWEPRCEECPCKAFCKAFGAGTAQSLPVRPPKKQKRQEDRTVLILECDGLVALQKRPDKGLLAGLWQFPNTEGTLEVSQAVALVEEWKMPVRQVRRQLEKKHTFTHIIWNMRCFHLEVGEKNEAFSWMTPEEIRGNTALPTAFRQFLEALE